MIWRLPRLIWTAMIGRGRSRLSEAEMDLFTGIKIKRSEIPTPALLIDQNAFNYNLAQMSRFFKDIPAKLRPHFKTHKCPTIAIKQIEEGAIGLTCAKLGEAEILVEAGIASILIANEVVEPNKIMRLADLALRSEIIVAIDDVETVSLLSAAAVRAGSIISVVIEVDVGLHRCGVRTGEVAVSLAKRICGLPGLKFAGLLGYEGHVVFIMEGEERKKQANLAIADLVHTAKMIRQDRQRSAVSTMVLRSSGGSRLRRVASSRSRSRMRLAYQRREANMRVM